MGLIIVLFILFCFLLIGSSYWIYRFIAKRNYPKALKLLALLPFMVAGYVLYVTLYPSDEFYKDDFTEIGGVAFPENGKLLYKTASYPDHFGDYTSVSVIETDSAFYNILPAMLVKNGMTDTGKWVGSEEMDNALSSIKDKKIIKEYTRRKEGGYHYYIAFLSDGKTIIAERVSW